MSENISLHELLNLSIGTPHKGTVNFSALYALLLAVLKQLNIRELKIQWRNSIPGDTSPDALVDVSARDRQSKEEELEEGKEVRRDISESEQPHQPRSDGSPRPASDSAPVGRGTLLTRIQTVEDVVSEAMELMKELQKQKDDLMEKIEELQQQHKVPDSQTGTPTELEKCCHRVDALENAVRSLRETLQKYPEPEKLSQQVPWDLVQSALFNANLTKGLTNTNVLDPNISVEPDDSPAIGPPRTPSSSSPDEHHITLEAPPSLNVSESALNTREADTAAEASSVQQDPPSQVTDDPDLNADNVEAQQASSSAWYQEMMEAVRTINKLQERFIQLEGRMEALEQMTDLAQLRELTTNKGSVESDSLMAELNQQKALIENLMSDREKLDNLKDMLMNHNDEGQKQQLRGRQPPKNMGLAKDVQRLVLQLQGDCEKLQETTRNLQEDDRQKQGRIKELYKMTEELEVKKADKLESEKKTGKKGLENNVSQLQFDFVIQQQNSKYHELLNKVTAQQQNWQELIHRLSSEMEKKLNRIELDSLMMQLEKRCKNIQEKLETQESLPEHDSASLFKKQFHCLSCDRPVLMQIPGPTLNTLPSYPAFPCPKSTKPFNSDQVRQQYKRLKPGISRYNCWMSTSGRKRTEFQRSYNDMCKQIESMESQRRQENWDSINQNSAGVQHEWMSELADFQVVPRSAGGSHINTEANGVTQETGIIGSDGHIYKGFLSVQALKNTETRLPTIPTKDVTKTKNKAKSSASQRRVVSPEVGHTTPVHQPPLSARSTQCSRSVSSCSGRDWPVSALGCCTSRSSITSAAADSATDPQSDEPVNL